MTHISELIAEARHGARHFARCSTEQALVYSCERVASRHVPLRELTKRDVESIVEDICMVEDIDIPFIQFGGRTGRCTAWADRTTHTIGFMRRNPTLDDVIHEISHLVSRGDGHDDLFRSTLVRLGRRHAGVEWASLLHHLFVGVGLDQSDW